jgi:hypothetical protein
MSALENGTPPKGPRWLDARSRGFGFGCSIRFNTCVFGVSYLRTAIRHGAHRRRQGIHVRRLDEFGGLSQSPHLGRQDAAVLHTQDAFALHLIKLVVEPLARTPLELRRFLLLQ